MLNFSVYIVLFLVRTVRPPRYLKIAPNPDQWVPPTSKHGPVTTPETPRANPSSKHLLPPPTPMLPDNLDMSKIFKIIPKGCERSQTEEGCLLNAFSEFLRKKTKFPDGVVGVFHRRWGLRGGSEPKSAILPGTLPGHLEVPGPSYPHVHAQGTFHWHWAPLGTTHGLVTGLKRG